MSRLINEDDGIEQINDWLDSIVYCIIAKRLSSYAELMGCIQDAPTIDAEPVVRCGECGYAHLTTDGKLVKYCDNWCDENQIAMELYLPSDFFCAFGERKKE